METIHTYGTEAQKQQFLPSLVSGQWTGTMCLTEAHCGSDLGLLKTRAVPQEDGSYSLTGTKIFITAGEHDMSDNIVHIVLARLPDAPAGTKVFHCLLYLNLMSANRGNPGSQPCVLWLY